MKLNTKTRKVLSNIFLLIAVVGIVIFLYSQFNENKKSKIESEKSAEDSQIDSITPYYPDETSSAELKNGYSINLTNINHRENSDWSRVIDVMKDGKLVFSVNDHDFSLFGDQYAIDEIQPSIEIFTAKDLVKYAYKDVNKDGIPELSFVGWSGGAHCCFTAHVLELGDEFKELWSMDTEDASAEFVDKNKDGVMEIETSDAFLAYWNTNFADSPFPYVYLSYDKKQNLYVVDQKLMLKPKPTDEYIAKRASVWIPDSWSGMTCEGDPDPCVPWSYLTYLLYSGNMESAKKYLDLAWRDNKYFKSKDDFINQFREMLKSSKYYDDLSSGLIDLSKF